MTVLGRIHANRAKECPPHDLGAAEAALGGDGFDATRRLLKTPPSGFDPGALDEPSRRHADFAREHAGEITSAHRRPPGEPRHREVGARMLADPRLEVPEGLAIGDLGHQGNTELRLATGALQEHHELSGHGQGDLASMVLLDQREREIHPSRDTGRGVNAPVTDEDRVSIDRDAGIPLGELSAGAPVRRRTTTIEESSLS